MSEPRYCCFCTGALALPYFTLVKNIEGVEVRVHKGCAVRARDMWDASPEHRQHVMHWDERYIRERWPDP